MVVLHIDDNLSIVLYMQKLLFICSANRLRSPTAETVFSELPDVSVKSAGTSPFATVTVSDDLLDWADMIFVMEEFHYIELVEQFGTLIQNKPLFVLDIPDIYQYMQPELVEILKTKVSKHLQ